MRDLFKTLIKNSKNNKKKPLYFFCTEKMFAVAIENNIFLKRGDNYYFDGAKVVII